VPVWLAAAALEERLGAVAKARSLLEVIISNMFLYEGVNPMIGKNHLAARGNYHNSFYFFCMSTP